MNDFKHNFNGNEDDDDPLQLGPVLMRQVVVDHIHHLQAVVQLLVDHLGPLGHGQVCAGGHE